MYNSVIEYQHAYFKKLFDLTELEFGYFTQSDDLEYINSNSIIVTEVTGDVVASVCSLLATDVYTTKIQFPRDVIEFGDEDDTLYLIKYDVKRISVDDKLSLELVTAENYQQFIELSSKLQVQEYGQPYKQNTNQAYLNQASYQMYMIKYGDCYVGELIYIEELRAVESIIIDRDYQRMGIGHQTLEVLAAKNGALYLSADLSSIGFYRKIDGSIIDSYLVKNLYGNARNLLMYISLCI